MRCGAFAVATLGALQVSAQATTDQSPLSRCLGQRITKILIEPVGPQFSGPSSSSRVVTGLLQKFHVASRRRVIREFVQMREGEICTELKRRETERVLRAQWFIQDAKVLVYPDRDGVQLIVTTVDDVAILGGASARGTSLTALNVGSSNLMGRGLFIETGWRDNGALRDGRSIQLRSAITFGRPIQSIFNWSRGGLGGRADAELRYPFITDLQRFAFRALVGRDDDFVQFVRDTGSQPLQQLTRGFGSLGGVARIGQPGALLLAGASLSYDDESIGGAVVVSDSGSLPFLETLPRSPAPPQNATRANLLFGGRVMRFLPVEGFDALTGVQDLRIGVQFGGQFGRPLKLRGITTADFFVSGDIYAGWGTPKFFVGSEWVFSGRKGQQNGWDGRLVSGRAAMYVKPARRTTSIASVEFTGGNDVRVPFQVPLAGSRYGVRGFERSRDGGESRVVMRAEQRQAIGSPWGFADVGAAVFSETGRLWAGSAPFGVTTPWRSSIGAGVLFAIPPRSRRLYRFDVAYGLNPDRRSSRFEYRLTSGNFTRNFWEDPGESRRARERSLITNLFAF